MLRRRLDGRCLSLIGAVCCSVLLVAATSESPVADAAMNRNHDAVRSLLNEAADVNAAQADGMTALHWAAMNGDVPTAQLLLVAGAHVAAATRLGALTPLELAAENGHAAMVKVLLDAGASAATTDGYGTTALMLASAAGSAEAVTALIDHKADVNATESSRARDGADVRGGTRPDRRGQDPVGSRRGLEADHANPRLDHSAERRSADAGDGREQPRRRRAPDFRTRRARPRCRTGCSGADHRASSGRRFDARLSAAGQQTGRPDGADVCRSPGLHRHGEGSGGRRRRRQRNRSGRPLQPADGCGSQRPVRYGHVPAEPGRQPEPGGGQRCDAALRRTELRLGLAHGISAAAGVHAAEDALSDARRRAVGPRRGSESETDAQGLVFRVQPRQVRSG